MEDETQPLWIICGTREQPHGHIVGVGLGRQDGSLEVTMTVSEVRDALYVGQTFYTFGKSTERVALVYKATCGTDGCPVETIRSGVGAVADNNLDNLEGCP
jgi:hypothetical protein